METNKGTHKATVLQDGETKTIRFNAPTSLSALLEQQEISLYQPCGGNGTCGKCKVRAEGALSAPLAQEHHLLTGELEKGYRLGCLLELTGDAVVELPSAAEEGFQIMTSPATEALPEYDGESPNTYGIAVDIGTTTVVSYLYRFSDKTCLSVQSGVNAQSSFGADIIARIEHSNQHGVSQLHRILVKQLRELFLANAKEAKIALSQISRMVITGNTTMLHYLTKKDPRGIGVSPFTPESLFGYDLPAKELFGEEFSSAKLYLPPCISAYTGADIVCGMIATLAANSANSTETTLLVDVGTNGEMVLSTGEKLVSCATAAGPAFEGREISMGMPASAGAISNLWAENGNILYRTLENAPAKGLCGTGILSGVRTMLECGILDDTGLIEKEGHDYTEFIVTVEEQPAFQIEGTEVVITQKDIRKIQLAKAAIAAGVDAMLHQLSTPPASVKRTYLSGGFGNYLNPRDAVRIGLLPKDLLSSIQSAGNTSGHGAIHLLLSQKARKKAEEIAKNTTDLELSTSAYFMERYTENMFFPE